MRHLLFLILLSITSCDKADELLTFSISNETDFTIESQAMLELPFNIGTPDVATESEQSFANNNTRADLVREIRLEELVLTITAPSGNTFSFLKSIHIYVSANGNETELAWLDDVPASGTVSLETTDEELDAYVKADSYKLRVSVVTDETLTEDVDVTANMRFRVRANAL